MSQRPALIVRRFHDVRLSCVAFLLVLLRAAAPASAQWTVTILDEPFGPGSQASAVFAQQQVGSYAQKARLWTGSAASQVNLHSFSIEDSSWATGTSGTQQVGAHTLFGLITHACMWSGTAESFVSLNPPGAAHSQANGIAGSQQVGWAIFGSTTRAGLWTGSAASWLDLHPAASSDSFATATSGHQQVGAARVGNAYHASLWRGRAASWVDLHPAGMHESVATCTTGKKQAGYVMSSFQAARHAALWSGSAASFIDLHPAGAQASEVTGMAGNFQVGTVIIDGLSHASVWRGSAASWVDLSAFGPAGFQATNATGIWTDGTITHVSGAGNGSDYYGAALLWTSHSAQSAADLDDNGVVNLDDLLAVMAAWGPCPAQPTSCPANLITAGPRSQVDLHDLLAVIGEWGPCQ